MQPVLLLLLGAHLAYAGTHSFKAFYTVTTGITNYPEFTTMAVVDGVLINTYDSISKQVVPRTEWMKNSEGPDYWKQQTDIIVGAEQNFKNNIQVAMGRFNQTGGVHSFQFMVGCELDDDGTKRGYWEYGYDGEDFISFDKSSLTWTAANDKAMITKRKWDAEKAFGEYNKGYLEKECIEWVQKYVGYGKSTLERKDAPEVFLLQKDSSSPVLCQATGFYPSNIMMTWQKKGEDHHEDVEVGTTLPNADGTFQKTVTLSVEEWKKSKNDFRCVVQHEGAVKDIVVTVDDIRSNPGSDNTIVIIVGCVVGFAALLAVIVGLFFWRKSNAGYGRASTKDSDSENSDQALEKVTAK